MDRRLGGPKNRCGRSEKLRNPAETRIRNEVFYLAFVRSNSGILRSRIWTHYMIPQARRGLEKLIGVDRGLTTQGPANKHNNKLGWAWLSLQSDSHADSQRDKPLTVGSTNILVSILLPSKLSGNRTRRFHTANIKGSHWTWTRFRVHPVHIPQPSFQR
jgi:hypothetical protein